ncbi:hypothetical protein L9F63_002385, partial [Diploptera punctata]
KESKLCDTFEEPLDTFLEDKSMLENTVEERTTWEYHVMYNQSYSVPTLHFNAWRSDGALLSLEEVWGRALKCYRGSLEDDKWTVLTQQEHPILRRPFYTLHPCRTAEFLESLKEKSSNILITWLSTFGPVVGLLLDFQYGRSVASANH